MNNLTKAYLKATLYFYTIMTVPFALAWGLYAAGINLDALLGLGPVFGDKPGLATDMAALIFGVLPGAFLLRKKMKANAETITAASEAPPLSGQGLQSLFLSVFLTGALGFGLYMLLVFVFTPNAPTALDAYFITREPGTLMGMAERLELFRTGLPIMLSAGALFGAFMWGASQRNKIVRFGTWAAFIACIYFNPFTLFVEQTPPTLMQQVAQDIKMSPPLEKALEEFGVDEQDLQPEPGP